MGSALLFPFLLVSEFQLVRFLIVEDLVHRYSLSREIPRATLHGNHMVAVLHFHRS